MVLKRQFGRSMYSREVPAGFELPMVYDLPPFHAYRKRYAEKVVHTDTVFESNGRKIRRTYAGIRTGKLELPYSAPFAMLCPRVQWRYEDVLDMHKRQKVRAGITGCDEVHDVLPPPAIYSPDLTPCESAFLPHRDSP
jgi:hypothetical protein